jgi:hypothetical protein
MDIEKVLEGIEATCDRCIENEAPWNESIEPCECFQFALPDEQGWQPRFPEPTSDLRDAGGSGQVIRQRHPRGRVREVLLGLRLHVGDHDASGIHSQCGDEQQAAHVREPPERRAGAHALGVYRSR